MNMCMNKCLSLQSHIMREENEGGEPLLRKGKRLSESSYIPNCFLSDGFNPRLLLYLS